MLVVGGGILVEGFVGVVTGDAGEAIVLGLAPTAAFFEAVGLEANDGGARGADAGDGGGGVGKGAMASAAEVVGVGWGEFSGIEDVGEVGVGTGIGRHLLGVGEAGAVAGFAAESGFRVEGVEALRGSGVDGVTAEAAAGVFGAEGLAKCGGELVGGTTVEPGGDVECRERGVEGDEALIPPAVELIEEGAAEVTGTEDPVEIVGEAVRAVGYGVANA